MFGCKEKIAKVEKTYKERIRTLEDEAQRLRDELAQIQNLDLSSQKRDEDTAKLLDIVIQSY
ncbi:MAG TPA: hypothetical protein ENJ67_01160, partial [Sulfurimonas autotrophica]|nr:hypothetical protein [Sulfurimonas autotrophica]